MQFLQTGGRVFPESTKVSRSVFKNEYTIKYFFKKVCLLKNFNQTHRTQHWQASWKTFIRISKLFGRRPRTFIKKFSSKTQKKFCARRMQFWQTGLKILFIIAKSFCWNSEKKAKKILQKRPKPSSGLVGSNFGKPDGQFQPKTNSFFNQISKLMKQHFFSGEKVNFWLKISCVYVECNFGDSYWKF